MMIKIPPKYSVAEVVGYMKGKSTIAVARQFSGRKQNFNGEKLWARDYAVSTVGFEEVQICKYIENQQQLDGKGEDEKVAGTEFNLAAFEPASIASTIPVEIDFGEFTKSASSSGFLFINNLL